MLLWLALSANSQPPPPDSKEREAFYEALFDNAPHKELFDLLDHESIRLEIELSDLDAEAIKTNERNTIDALRKIREADGGKQLTPEKLKQKVHESIAPFNQLSYEILEKNSNFDRLLGLYVQARGCRALLNDKVAKKIGLEGEALEKFRKLRRETWQGLMVETNDAIKRHLRNTPPGTQPPRGVISDLYKLAEKKLEEKLSGDLSEQQIADFELLKGEKFPLPEHPFNYPGRGRGRSRGSKDNDSDRGPDKPPPSRKADSVRCSAHNISPSFRISCCNLSQQISQFF